MTLEMLKAIFLLVGTEIENAEQIPNRYWPDASEYDKLRENYPWWKVTTKFGEITLGWRKRVIHIDWADCVKPVEGFTRVHRGNGGLFNASNMTARIMELDFNNVTNWESGCHAYGYGPTITYLKRLFYNLTQFTLAAVPPRGEKLVLPPEDQPRHK